LGKYDLYFRASQYLGGRGAIVDTRTLLITERRIDQPWCFTGRLFSRHPKKLSQNVLLGLGYIESVQIYVEIIIKKTSKIGRQLGRIMIQKLFQSNKIAIGKPHSESTHVGLRLFLI